MFDDFKQFIGRRDLPNHFYPCSDKDIADAERRLGHSFPGQLRHFFREVGCGFYRVGINDEDRDPTLINRIVPPDQIADLLLVPDNPWRPHEGFADDALPFLDCGDNTYLVLMPKSDQPNAVYWPGGKLKIADSLEEFFFKLYEHADFYLREFLEQHPDG